MNRLLIILPLIVLNLKNGHTARVPKIYNALITSDENLSPSQAYPLIEPVLRPTAYGVPLPPLLVRNPPQPLQPPQAPPQPQNPEAMNTNARPAAAPPQLRYHGSLYPVAYDPYFAYGYHNELLYPVLPYYQQPIYVDYGHYQSNNNPPNANQNSNPVAQPPPPPSSNQPPQSPPPNAQQPPPNLPISGGLPPQALNFKKNPEIPDVIPPLPVAARKRQI